MVLFVGVEMEGTWCCLQELRWRGHGAMMLGMRWRGHGAMMLGMRWRGHGAVCRS